jgi:uncharacterized protein (DUF2141 family)
VRHRSRSVAALTVTALTGAALGLALLPAASLGAEPPAFDVSLTVNGLRSSHGQVLACLTALPSAYPDCSKDPNARKRAVPASPTVKVDFGAVPAGVYAIAVVHDENGNGRMDKRLGLPTEGYGFSRDAPIRFGPPSFHSAQFTVSAPDQETIRMRYLI